MNEALFSISQPPPAFKIALLCVGMQAALVFGLGFNVSMHRLRFGRGQADESEARAALRKAVRAHGNAAEYVPTLSILILVLAALGPGPLVTGLFVAATASRYCHALGMFVFSGLDRPNPLRFVGAAGTYTTGLLMTAALLLR